MAYLCKGCGEITASHPYTVCYRCWYERLKEFSEQTLPRVYPDGIAQHWAERKAKRKGGNNVR